MTLPVPPDCDGGRGSGNSQFNPLDTESVLAESAPTYYEEPEPVVDEAPQFPSYYQEAVVAEAAPPYYQEAVVVEAVGDNGEYELNPAPVVVLNTNANQLGISSGGGSGTSSVSYVGPSSSSSSRSPSSSRMIDSNSRSSSSSSMC